MQLKRWGRSENERRTFPQRGYEFFRIDFDLGGDQVAYLINVVKVSPYVLLFAPIPR